MARQRPIGVFDSGLGGLSVGHAIRELLPNEDLAYFADLKYSPYGPKSQEVIAARSRSVVDFLVDQGCKLIVVACNTATVNSIATLRSNCSIPLVGVEPGVKPAAIQSKRGVIGILATEQALKSHSYQQLKAIHSKEVRVEEKACPDFVSLVEELNHESEAATSTAERYILPMLAAGCDQIVLGCTHFSFLKPAITKVIDDKAELVDTAQAVAKEVRRRLSQLDMLNADGSEGAIKFWTNGDSASASKSIAKLWQQHVTVLQADAKCTQDTTVV